MEGLSQEDQSDLGLSGVNKSGQACLMSTAYLGRGLSEEDQSGLGLSGMNKCGQACLRAPLLGGPI